jgi:SdrD B-like domain
MNQMLLPCRQLNSLALIGVALFAFLVSCVNTPRPPTVSVVPPAAASTAPPVAATTGVTSGATISGIVWNDLCDPELPGQPAPATPPPGCVRAQTGIYRANGIIDPGERGIANVRIALGRGACPVAGIVEATTDENGKYVFTGLSAGTYCVSAARKWASDNSVLRQGRFTFPGEDIGDMTVKVGENDHRVDVNFGWDYGAAPADSVTPIILCTPPPCKQNETYFCPGNCPGGCGTQCATRTPMP